VELPSKYFDNEITDIDNDESVSDNLEPDNSSIETPKIDEQEPINIISSAPASEINLKDKLNSSEKNPQTVNGLIDANSNVTQNSFITNNNNAYNKGDNLINETSYNKSDNLVNETSQNNFDNTVTNNNKENALDIKSLEGSVSELDQKIGELQNELKNITKVEKNYFDQILETDNTVNNKETVNVIDTKKNFNVQKLINNIKVLTNRRDNIYNQLQNKLKNSSYNIDKNFFSEFTPNFISPEKADSIQTAINTEQALGGEPVIANTSEMGPAVFDQAQGDLGSAISDHGDINNAINDSVNNQEFVKKEGSQDIFNNAEQSTATNNEYVKNETNIDQSLPDSNLELTKNTGNMVGILNGLSKQIGDLNSNIMKSFKGMSTNINDIKSNQNNTVNNINNSNTSGGQQQTPGAAQAANNIPNDIRGDLPLDRYFPKDFDRNKLGGNQLINVSDRSKLVS
jgi:hypothetical protein